MRYINVQNIKYYSKYGGWRKNEKIWWKGLGTMSNFLRKGFAAGLFIHEILHYFIFIIVIMMPKKFLKEKNTISIKCINFSYLEQKMKTPGE